MTKRGAFRKGLLYGSIVIIAGVLLFWGYRERVKWRKDHILVELRPIQTKLGWGYDILANGKIFLHQPDIPAIQGEYGFRTKEDALAVGGKVVERIMQGKMPMVTAKEVREMGLDPNASASPK